MTLPKCLSMRWQLALPRRLKNYPLLTFLALGFFILYFLYWPSQAKQHSATWSFSPLLGEYVRVAVCASDWYAPIRAKVNGSYRLLLNILVDPTTATTEFDRVSSINVVKYDSHPRLLSFENMAEIEDQIWRLPVDKQVYQLYPQSMNMSDVVSRVKSCRPVPEVSPHGFPGVGDCVKCGYYGGASSPISGLLDALLIPGPIGEWREKEVDAAQVYPHYDLARHRPCINLLWSPRRWSYRFWW
ncbi:unnamed protein product [Dibothriocephalus latus]|uniref:Hexosyltransferase n=1 Tax=Dibothriocephalus latus TaxID=60516 RepID=A0A3P6UBF2_DIBLA|nr:unnamed protein product [Dibothriocephalus latus]